MSEKEKQCMACIKQTFPCEKGELRSLISHNETVLASVNPRPNSKAHTVLVTKRHAAGLNDLTSQEWNDILPVLKDSINKIENYYKFRGKSGPLGYRFDIPDGKKAGQNEPFHFYIRLTPKYKKDYGYVGSTGPYRPATPEEEKKIQDSLGIKQDNIISETDRLIAKLNNQKSAAYTVITTKKHLPCEVEAIDSDTWNEVGKMLKALTQKLRNDLEEHPDFQISIQFGKEAQKVIQKEKEEYLGEGDYDPNFIKNLEEGSSTGELTIKIVPRYKLSRYWIPDERFKSQKEKKPIGTMENERIAEKLNNPEEYCKIWGKKTTFSVRGHEEATNLQNQETKAKASIWKQPTLYWGIASGVGICLLGMGIYWLFSKNTKAKSK